MKKPGLKKPATDKKLEAAAPPDCERHDEVYFRHATGPKMGRVLSRGEHGCWVECDGVRHQMRWADYHGHKTRVRPEVKVVDQGDDGMLVEDRAGNRRFVSDPMSADAGAENGLKPTDPLAKSLTPVVLILNAGPADLLKAAGGGRRVAGGAGLSLQTVTDKAGHQTKRWKKTGVDQKAQRPAGRAEEPSSPNHGRHNVKSGDRVSFKMGTVSGKGQVVSTGAKGATVEDAESHPHKVEWAHIAGHEAGGGGKSAGRDPGHTEGSAFYDLPPAGVDALINDVNRAVAAAKMDDLFAGPETDALPLKVAGKLDSWEAISEAQDEAQAGLKSMLDDLAKAMSARDVGQFNDDTLAGAGVVYGMGPPKTEESAARKVNDKYGGDWSKLGDAVRASIGFDSVDQLREGIEMLRAAGLKLATKPDNKFVNPTDAGYRDMNLNFEMPNGVVGELQLHLKPILRAKSKGHKDYDVTRILSAKEKNDPPLSPSETQELNDRLMRQRVLYTRAMQEALGAK